MAAKHFHHVALTSAHAEYIMSQVTKSQHAWASEVIRVGQHLLIDRDAAHERGSPAPPLGQATVSA